jgi:putative ABC transport system permease protein
MGFVLNAATARYPAVVLGSKAAARLGIHSLDGDPVVYLGGRWFSVVGILDSVPLLPNIDSSALIGYPIAHDLFGTDLNPSTVYVLTETNRVEAVRSVLAATANPQHPNEVSVSRPRLLGKSAASAAQCASLGPAVWPCSSGYRDRQHDGGGARTAHRDRGAARS